MNSKLISQLRHGIALVVALGTIFCGGQVVAQSAADKYPEKAIKIVVPFPPGGGTDIVARTIAAQLSTRLGQTVVVENRPGAGGTIGANAVAISEPDGYTIGIATSSTHPAAVVLRNDLPYDPLQSFAPITQIGSTAYVLVASPELPAKNPETNATVSIHTR